MRIVVALGGNALLRRGEPMTPEAQHTNVRVAAQALADLARDHQIIVAHGNGPQVGLMALQAAAYAPQSPWPLDILGAETEGMIGYLIEQELVNALPAGANCATLLTRVEVDRDDPAFLTPDQTHRPGLYGERSQGAAGQSRLAHDGCGPWQAAPRCALALATGHSRPSRHSPLGRWWSLRDLRWWRRHSGDA